MTVGHAGFGPQQAMVGGIPLIGGAASRQPEPQMLPNKMIAVGLAQEIYTQAASAVIAQHDAGEAASEEYIRSDFAPSMQNLAQLSLVAGDVFAQVVRHVMSEKEAA